MVKKKNDLYLFQLHQLRKEVLINNKNLRVPKEWARQGSNCSPGPSSSSHGSCSVGQAGRGAGQQPALSHQRLFCRDSALVMLAVQHLNDIPRRRTTTSPFQRTLGHRVATFPAGLTPWSLCPHLPLGREAVPNRTPGQSPQPQS